jgi:hypothetical protein
MKQPVDLMRYEVNDFRGKTVLRLDERDEFNRTLKLKGI